MIDYLPYILVLMAIFILLLLVIVKQLDQQRECIKYIRILESKLYNYPNDTHL